MDSLQNVLPEFLKWSNLTRTARFHWFIYREVTTEDMFKLHVHALVESKLQKNKSKWIRGES